MMLSEKHNMATRKTINKHSLNELGILLYIHLSLLI